MIDSRLSSTATWWWHGGPVDAPTTRFLRENGVTEVSWSLPWTGPADEDRDGISALRRSGFQVSGLGGDRTWAFDPGLADQWAQRALAGGTATDLHLDIEPWSWEKPPAPLPELLEGLAEAVRRVAVRSQVEVDVAAWIAGQHPEQF